MKKLLLLCLLALTGCLPTATDAKNSNEASFKSPEYVGEVQGKKIYHCVVLVKFGDGYRTQHIYFVGNTITVNDPVSRGSDEVSVIIDGVPYLPVQAEIHK